MYGVSSHGGRSVTALTNANTPQKNVSTQDRKSTRLNSSHLVISYAVFCLKKKNDRNNQLVFNHHSFMSLPQSTLVACCNSCRPPRTRLFVRKSLPTILLHPIT